MDFSDQENLQEIIKEIQMFKVYSTNIVALGYDESRKILRVIFKGNSSDLYFNVEPKLWENWKNSQTKDRTLGENII